MICEYNKLNIYDNNRALSNLVYFEFTERTGYSLYRITGTYSRTSEALFEC